MSKKIHVTVSMGLRERLRFLFSPGAIDILFEKTIVGPKVVDIRVRGRKAKRLRNVEDAHAATD